MESVVEYRKKLCGHEMSCLIKRKNHICCQISFLCLLFQWQHILHNMFVRRVHWSSGLTHIKGYVCNGCAPLKDFTTCVDLIPDLC